MAQELAAVKPEPSTLPAPLNDGKQVEFLMRMSHGS